MQFASVSGYQCCCRCTFAHSQRASDSSNAWRSLTCPARQLAPAFGHTTKSVHLSGDLRMSHRTFGPPRRVRLTRLHRIAFQALETCPPVIGNDGLHAFMTVRATRRVHRRCSISNKTPHWNKGSVAAFTIAFSGRRPCRQRSTGSCKPTV